MDSLTPQFFACSAYLSAAATILTFVTGMLFFTLGERFGKINDISSVFQVLFMIPLGVLSVRFFPEHLGWLGLIAAVLGISGMLVSAYGQSLLVLGRIDFEASRRFFPAGGAIGIWLILVCVAGASNGVFPELLAWTGILAGLGYLGTVIGFLRGGAQNALFYGAALVLGISYPVWAIWLARLLLSGTWGMDTG